MSNLETKCPICGHETLNFSQNADIRYEVVDGKLRPILEESEISWMDDTSLFCSHCMANDFDNAELAQIKFEYHHHI